jgi:hypothetical protein
MFPDNKKTCWGDQAYQKCPKNRQGTYDLVMKAGGSNEDAYCTLEKLQVEGTYKDVQCNDKTPPTKSATKDDASDSEAPTECGQGYCL